MIIKLLRGSEHGRIRKILHRNMASRQQPSSNHTNRTKQIRRLNKRPSSHSNDQKKHDNKRIKKTFSEVE